MTPTQPIVVLHNATANVPNAASTSAALLVVVVLFLVFDLALLATVHRFAHRLLQVAR